MQLQMHLLNGAVVETKDIVQQIKIVIEPEAKRNITTMYDSKRRHFC